MAFNTRMNENKMCFSYQRTKTLPHQKVAVTCVLWKLTTLYDTCEALLTKVAVPEIDSSGLVFLILFNCYDSCKISGSVLAFKKSSTHLIRSVLNVASISKLCNSPANSCTSFLLNSGGNFWIVENNDIAIIVLWIVNPFSHFSVFVEFITNLMSLTGSTSWKDGSNGALIIMNSVGKSASWSNSYLIKLLKNFPRICKRSSFVAGLQQYCNKNTQ